VQQYSDADTQPKLLFNLLGDIEDLAGHTPASVEEIAEWAAIVNAAEETERATAKFSKESHLVVPCTAHIQ
jgi:hypothetical protein